MNNWFHTHLWVIKADRVYAFSQLYGITAEWSIWRLVTQITNLGISQDTILSPTASPFISHLIHHQHFGFCFLNNLSITSVHTYCCCHSLSHHHFSLQLQWPQQTLSRCLIYVRYLLGAFTRCLICSRSLIEMWKSLIYDQGFHVRSSIITVTKPCDSGSQKWEV